MNKWISRAVRQGYNSMVGDIVVRLGLRQPLKHLYSLLLYYASSGSKSVSIGGVNANFIIDSPLTAFEVHQNITNESIIIEHFISVSDEDDVFYDIGAGVGSYTCFVGRSVRKTVSFEPNDERWPLLKKNIDRNEIDADVMSVALGEEDGKNETNEYIDMGVKNGDEFRREKNLPIPDLIKIDVDGPELHVLRGLSDTLQRNTRLIWIEVHPNRIDQRGHSISDLEEFLDELGFDTELKSIKGLKSPYLKATR